MKQRPAALSRSRVIARGRRIREVRRLVNLYGGRISKWVKKRSPPFETRGRILEHHWYEHPGLGRFEVGIVEVSRS